MPQQITGIQITDHGDGTCDVQVGPSGFGGLDVQAAFFDRSTFSQDQLVGNYVATGVSQEFAARLAMRGVHLSDGDYPHLDLVYNGDGTATVSYSGQTVTLPAEQLEGDTGDQQVLLANVASFLRLAGFDSLTQGAIDAVAARTFWV